MNGPDPSERWRELDRLEDGTRRAPATSEAAGPSPYESYPWAAVGGPPPLPTYPASHGQPWTPGGLPLRHPSASGALALGLLGVIGGPLCWVPLVASPVAVAMGRRALREIDVSGGAQTGRGAAVGGVVLGALGSAFLAFLVVALVVYVAT